MVTPASVDTLSQLLTECRARPIVYDGVRPDLCVALEGVIMARMQADRGRKTGSLNVGGWKSAEDFFAWPDSCVQELRTAFADLIGPRPLVGWAMVNRRSPEAPEGSHHPRHQHRAAILSGVYYVASGSPITPTVFECPCDGRKIKPGESYEMDVDPHPGRLVVCRGETWHKLPAYSGDAPRITVAFDIRR